MFNKSATAFVTASVLAIATPFVAKWEGVELVAYKDIVGVPTVCYGETRGVKMGDKYTKEQCEQKLKEALGDYYVALSPSIKEHVPVGVRASLLELSYNVGIGAVKSSTMLKLANQGKYKEACAQLDKWVKAGGGKVKGLVNRRADSKVELCLRGL